MGEEARTTLTRGEQKLAGKAVLETDELVFRGDARLVIPFRDVRSVASHDGRLTVAFGDEMVTFELGEKAARWAEKIRHPKTLVDKLGVKAGARVAVVRVADEEFRRDLAERVGEFRNGEPTDEVDLVFLGAESVADLGDVVRVQERLARDGAIWVVAPKGGREPREAQVLAAGKDAGLVDTKVVRFSATHTAHKFVIPVARR